MRILIDDGYTITTPVTVGQFPTFTVTYRPALAKAVYEWLGSQRGNGKQRLDATIALLDTRLQSWDVKVKPEDAEPAPCTQENWAKLPQPILEELANLVAGYVVPQSEGSSKN